ncbi:MAG: carboxypeptidase-like regulatory domain-containing protein [Schleiferiaceae bacterium]
MRRLVLLALLVVSSTLGAQTLTQTIRGTVVDSESKSPLPDAMLICDNVQAFSDEYGQFEMDVEIGRKIVAVQLFGYEPTSAVVELNSAKQAVIRIAMTESTVKLDEVDVVATPRGDVKNEMAVVSARKFSVEETNLYAGSRGEPARMATNFAGVQGSDDTRNDIVVRGNTPAGILYRFEGINIPNPNHFAIPGTGGGPVTILNNKYIQSGDFYTGAWPGEYGNAIAGVFDLEMRDGNNATPFEGSFQFGLLGVELMAEGRLGKEKPNAPSYLVLGRYSTLGMASTLGIPLGTTAIPNYADGAFRVTFPQKDGSKFSLWGMGGTSNLVIDISGTDGDPVTGDFEGIGTVDRDQFFDTHMGVVGATHLKRLDKTSYIKSGAAVSRSAIHALNTKVFRGIDTVAADEFYYRVDSAPKILNYWYYETKIHGYSHYTKKIDARQSFKAGVNVDYVMVDYLDSTRIVNGLTGEISPWEFPWGTDDGGFSSDGYAVVQPFVSYKNRLTDKLTMTAGLTALYSNINDNTLSPIEPRLGFNYDVDKHNKFFTGAGYHSQMQSSYLYYYRGSQATPQAIADGVYGTEYNKGMGLTKSAHLVAGWEHNFDYPVRIKLETYYQYLWDVPVEMVPSYFSLVNGGTGFGRLWAEPLENEGVGRNYGLEFTAEHYYRNGFYSLFTGSVFDAKYKGSKNIAAAGTESSDDIWVNTTFNGRYAFNFIMAKNYQVGKYGVFNLGTKVSSIGGRWFGDIDQDASAQASEIEFIDDFTFNSNQYRPYFRLDFKVGYKWNFMNLAHEFALDISNITNNKNILTLTYLPETGEVAENYQLGLFPVFYYKIDF